MSRERFGTRREWGPVTNGVPSIHALDTASRSSSGMVDFSTGQTVGGGSIGGSEKRLRNAHGVLCGISWGVLMPIGAMSARYLKGKERRLIFFYKDKMVEKTIWFQLHRAIQTLAYVIGVVGWATGLKLGAVSVGYTHKTHRIFGITLFVIGTLQVLSLKWRPKDDNSKCRRRWAFYHRCLGYSAIVLIVNVFKGLDILDPEKKWKKAYTGLTILLGVITVVLEFCRWMDGDGSN